MFHDPRCCCRSHGERLCPVHQPLWPALLVLLLGLALGCAGRADGGCEQSAYELEGHYRCTAAGELQTLSCGEWETLVECGSGSACSPGPELGCRQTGWVCGGESGLSAHEAEAFDGVCECPNGFVRPVPGTLGECIPRVD